MAVEFRGVSAKNSTVGDAAGVLAMRAFATAVRDD